MLRRSRNPRRLALAAAVAVAMPFTMIVPLALFGGTVPLHAAAAGGPSVTATPSTNLADGQYVKLQFTGFPAAEGIAFRQCTATATTIATDCTAVNQAITPTTDANGGGATYFPVYAGSDLQLTNDSRSGQVPCDAQHACVIAAMHDTSSLGTAVFATIAFGPSPEACPPPAANAVLGSGSSSAYRAIYAWESAVCTPPANLSVQYSVNNSTDGVANFLKGLTNFAVTGNLTPVTPPATTLTYRYAPLTASAVVFAYRMYDRRGPQITTLTLTPDILARLMTGRINNLSADPDVKKLNPGIQFPPRLATFARAEHSAQTYALTSWLSATSPKIWTAGPRDIFPLPPSGVTGVTANTGLAVVDPTTDFTGQGNIGFMDSSTAAFYGLPTVQIKLANGATIAATGDSGATMGSISHSLSDATVNADGTLTPNFTTTDRLAYPILLPTYLVAPTNTIPGDVGKALAAFLRYSVQAGQGTLPPGYAPLTANLVAISLNVADLIPAVVPPLPPTPSPAPPVLPTPTPSILRPAFPPPPSLPPLVAPTATPCVAAAVAAIRPGLPPGGAVVTSTKPCPVTVTPSPTKSHGAVLAITDTTGGQRSDLGLLARLGDTTAAQYVLPGATVLAVAGLVIGSLMQALARRRFPVA